LKIYTKTGDKGETGLYGGKRVRKDNVRVSAYGDIDETNAAIGIARSYIVEGSSGSREILSFIDSALETVQNKLFAVGATLAGAEDQSYSVKDSDLEYLERCIDHMDEQVQPIKAFILARRAERNIVALSSQETVDPNIIAYANRLSDFLFTLARYANKSQGVPDTLWKKDFVPTIMPPVQTKLDTKQQQENHNHADSKQNTPKVVTANATNGKNGATTHPA